MTFFNLFPLTCWSRWIWQWYPADLWDGIAWYQSGIMFSQ